MVIFNSYVSHYQRVYRLVCLESRICMQMPMMEPPTQFGLQSPGGVVWKDWTTFKCQTAFQQFREKKWLSRGYLHFRQTPSCAWRVCSMEIQSRSIGRSWTWTVSRLLEVVGQSPQTATLNLFSWLPKPCRCSGLWKSHVSLDVSALDGRDTSQLSKSRFRTVYSSSCLRYFVRGHSCLRFLLKVLRLF